MACIETWAWGGGTVINAVATYIGSAYAIGLRAVVEVCQGEYDEVRSQWGIDTSGLLRAIISIKRRLGIRDNFRVFTHGDLPPVGGLKSSSAVMNSVVAAITHVAGLRISPMELLRLNAESSLEVGISITGALDDAAASLLGGLVITDNRNMRIIRWMRIPELRVLVYVPKNAVRRRGDEFIERMKLMHNEVSEAIKLALSGDLLGAMRINNMAYLSALGFSDEPVMVARKLGVAGTLSGTGPAYVFLGYGAELRELANELSRLGGDLIFTNITNDGSGALRVVLGG